MASVTKIKIGGDERDLKDAGAGRLIEVNTDQYAPNIDGKINLSQPFNDLQEDIQRVDWKTGIKKYVARWDKVNSQCTRMNDASAITTTTTNFAHRGAKNGSYDNPFDKLYPWSSRKLCKVDRAAYKTLKDTGKNIFDSVTAWEGEPGFVLDGSGGFDGVYTPEFWGNQWEDGGYVYYGVADGPVPGWVHYPATIGGRYFGSKDASNKMTSIANAIPWRTDAMSVLTASAVSQGMTIDDIWTWSADSLLMIVEYATLNSQTAVGAGCDGLYRQSAEKVGADAAIGATLIKMPNAFVAACVAGAVIGLGTSDGGEQTAITRFISSADLDGADPLAATHKGVTIPALTANITTATFASIHGCFNAPDTDIGSKSGYIGTASKSNAYYRGRVAHANYWRYVLGAYRQKDTNKIWIAKSRQEAAAYDALNVAVHVDTGKVLATANGYIAALHFVEGKPAMPFTAETGGTAGTTNPVGDYLYMPAIDVANTVLRAGGNAYYGAYDGRFYAYWSSSAASGYWGISALPFLLNP